MTKLLLIVFVAGTLRAPCFAQNEKAPGANAAAKEKFYHLDFSVREVEGERIVNSRDYSLILSNTNSGSIRAGAHIPVGGINVGVYIDCKDAREIDNQFRLSVRTDINSVVRTDEKGPEAPITRNNSWQSDVLLPLRKSTLLFSSDDPATKRKIQLFLTVAPMY